MTITKSIIFNTTMLVLCNFQVFLIRHQMIYNEKLYNVLQIPYFIMKVGIVFYIWMICKELCREYLLRKKV